MTSVLLLVKISWRNVWRNPRGTLLTALALGLGLALLLISLGLLDGGHEQTIANGVRFGPGHVVIQAKGYQDTGSQELLLPARVVSTINEFLQTRSMKQVAARRESAASGHRAAEFRSQLRQRDHYWGHTARGARRVPDSSADSRRGHISVTTSATGIVIGADLARKLEVKDGFQSSAHDAGGATRLEPRSRT